jgi:hypothetical protein
LINRLILKDIMLLLRQNFSKVRLHIHIDRQNSSVFSEIVRKARGRGRFTDATFLIPDCNHRHDINSRHFYLFCDEESSKEE